MKFFRLSCLERRDLAPPGRPTMIGSESEQMCATGDATTPAGLAAPPNTVHVDTVAPAAQPRPRGHLFRAEERLFPASAILDNMASREYNPFLTR